MSDGARIMATLEDGEVANSADDVTVDVFGRRFFVKGFVGNATHGGVMWIDPRGDADAMDFAANMIRAVCVAVLVDAGHDRALALKAMTSGIAVALGPIADEMAVTMGKRGKPS